MNSKVLLTLCLLVVAASAIPQPQPGAAWGANPWASVFGGGGWAGANPWVGGPWGGGAIGGGVGWGQPALPAAGAGANPFIPPWIASAPWIPQWSPCTTVGATCSDCTTKSVCTPIGGITKACSDPTLPYCNLGECSATPSAECAPSTEAATTAA
ncbi:uncharacterized protein LOC128675158 [Plodia interpunctella]|uniref:uncharacterized protein LOC128675158 n=1 Tax=Plodia interpunctella TaxID=58824 RepID=UPI0023687BBB|nr:uncharacterized protein LOC128675158 [Plodia interpunctella]